MLEGTLSRGSPVELLEDHACGLGEVHGVEVKMVDAIGKQLAAHFSDKALSNVSDSNIVVLDRLKSVEPSLGDLGLHVVGSSEKASVCSNRHDTGENWDVDTTLANLLHPAKKVVGVVEHLGDDECGTHVDLLLEVIKELFLILVVVAALGVASDANVEVVAVGATDVLHKVASVLETTVGGGPLVLVSRRITTESENVGAAGLVSLEQGIIDLLNTHVGASQVHTGLEAVNSLSLENHLAGQLGDAASGAPCDVNELGAEVVHAIHTVVEVLNTLGGLGGEVLEGEGGLAAPLGVGEHLLDMHGEGGLRRDW